MSSTITTPAWIKGLGDSVLEADMTTIFASGTVTEAKMTKVFTDLASELQSGNAKLTTTQLTALKTIAANIGSIGASTYVQYITNALVNGNIANQTFTGGGKAVALGNLAVGSTATRLTELMDKWFLGTDNPASTVSMSGVPSFSVTYSTTTEPLFAASGPSASDINQGYLGDCYMESELAEVASQNPSIIKNMITDNGNGTYGVKFDFGGKVYYVTVNGALPDGGNIFNHDTSAIWASLIEKAFAELPTEAQLEGSTSAYSNSFKTIGNGGDPTYALELITGATLFNEFAADGSSWLNYTLNSSESWTGYEAMMSTASVLSALAADLAVGDDIDLSSYTNAKDSSGKTTLVADHAMSIIGYDASTGMLEIRNPWGTESGQTWDTTFEVSLQTLLSAGDSIVADNMGAATTVSGASVVAAAGLQAMSQVKPFSVSDTVANISPNVKTLAADTKLTSLTVNGTSGADTINLTGFGAAATINLGTNADKATISGSGASETINLGSSSSYDMATLGSGSETIDYTLGMGVLDVVNFSAAHDMLSIGLNGGSLTQTIIGGSDWISSTADLTHGVLLAGISTKQSFTTSGSVATLT